jgi:hypothetical protein
VEEIVEITPCDIIPMMARSRTQSSKPGRDGAEGPAAPARAAYLYCVVRSAMKPPAANVPAGLPGSTRPKVMPAGRSLWLVLSDVPLDRYGPGRLEEALRNLDWVAEVAVAHEAVVEHFARRRGAAVVPMKLFTMFSTAQRAMQEMAERRQNLESVFKRIAGCEEWGVRVIRSRQRATPAPSDGPRSGTAFLAARKEVRDRARAAVEKAVDAAESVFDELSPHAKDTRRRDDLPAGVSPPLLDAAFLVRSASRTQFRMAARRAAKVCAESGAEMTLTGPWPAYNFAQPRPEPA